MAELKKALDERGLSNTGLKAELVERLKAALLSEAGANPQESAPVAEEPNPLHDGHSIQSSSLCSWGQQVNFSKFNNTNISVKKEIMFHCPSYCKRRSFNE